VCASVLLRFHISTKDGVDRRLIALPVTSKKSENIGIEPQGNLPLGPWPADGVLEKIWIELRALREVNL
jgi:hypothetical protein